jgi:pyridoxal phosphate enzyme (YggS family)
VTSSVQDRLSEIEGRIARALARVNRRRPDLTLVAVTKVFPASVILAGYEAGLRDFGENYVQEFERKKPELSGLDGARFHMIGHLQSNKARLGGELFDVVQTVDTLKVARRLNDCRRELEIFIEVKLSEEATKRGAPAADVPALAEAISGLENLRLSGLMTMPPWSSDPETARPYFARLREMAGKLGLPGLSMGMSNDFEVAIEEGATHIRVGSALFGPRPKKH